MIFSAFAPSGESGQQGSSSSEVFGAFRRNSAYFFNYQTVIPKAKNVYKFKNMAVIFKPVMVKVTRRGSLNPHESPPGTSNGAKYDLVGASGEFRVTAPWKWKGSGDPRRPEEIWGGG